MFRDVYSDHSETNIIWAADKNAAPIWGTYAIGQGQGQWLGNWTDERIREHVCLIARACAGAASPSDDYRRIIAPGEPTQLVRDMLKIDGCGLFARGVLRLLGVTSSRLAPPYRVGAAFSDIADVFSYAYDETQAVIGQAAMKTATRGARRSHEALFSGALVVIGRGKRTHILVVDAIEKGHVWSIDGGQKDKEGRECITWRKRQYQTSPPMIGDREIIRWYDPAGLRHVLGFQWRTPFRDAAPTPPPADYPAEI